MTADEPPAGAGLPACPGAPGSGRAPVSARAHAKVNLGLRVLGRRGDGFHEVDTTLALLDLHDTLELAAAAGEGDTLERVPTGDDRLDGAAVPTDERNLVLRAVAAYRAAAVGGAAPPPLHLRLHKRIPVAGGLGGGSSDAAAALRLLAAAWPAPVDLHRLGATLGSDVPFFLGGRVAARARGRGERLEPATPHDARLVLVNPGVAVSATDAYRWWGEDGGRGSRAAGIGWGGRDLRNDLEPGVAARVEGVAEALALLRSTTTAPVVMSGSGATCLALFEPARAAEAEALLAAGRRLRPAWWWAAAAIAGPGVTPPGA